MSIEILNYDVMSCISSYIKGDFIAWTSTCKTLAALNTHIEKINRANTYETIIYSGIPSLKPTEKLLARFSKHLTVYLRDNEHQTYWKYAGKIYCYTNESLYQNANIPFYELRNSYDYENYRFNCIKRLGLTLSQLHLILNDISISDLEDAEYMEDISRHELITWDYISMRHGFDWYWKILSNKPNKNLEFIFQNPDKDFVWETVFEDKDIHVDFLTYILNNPGFTSRGIHRKIHRNPNLTIQFIKSNPDIPWGVENGVVKSQFISFAEMLKNTTIKWNWKKSIENEVLDIKLANHLIYLGYLQYQDFLGRQEFSWKVLKNFIVDLSEASYRPDIMEIVMENKNYNWNWSLISKNKYITLEFIAHLYMVNWDWKELSKLDIITWNFVSSFREKPWDAKEISKKPFVNWIIVTQNSWFPWCLKTIAIYSYTKENMSNTKRARSGNKLEIF